MMVHNTTDNQICFIILELTCSGKGFAPSVKFILLLTKTNIHFSMFYQQKHFFRNLTHMQNKMPIQNISSFAPFKKPTFVTSISPYHWKCLTHLIDQSEVATRLLLVSSVLNQLGFCPRLFAEDHQHLV